MLVVAAGCDTLRARQLANDGVNLYKKGDLNKAAVTFEKAAALDPRIPTLQLNLGFTYLSLYNSSPKSKEGVEAGGHAISAFRKYIELRPDDPRGRNYLLQTFVDTKRYEDAVVYFKPEIERTPPSLEAVTTLGTIASKTGRLDDALNWYRRRVELAPNDPDGHYSLGVLIWDHLHNHIEITGEQRVQLADQGIPSLKKAIELRPLAPDAYTYANLVYRERAKSWVGSLTPAAQVALVADPCGRPPPPDPNAPPPPPPKNPAELAAQQAAQKLIEEADAKRVTDCTEADSFRKKAEEVRKAQPQAPTPQQPAQPAGAK